MVYVLCIGICTRYMYYELMKRLHIVPLHLCINLCCLFPICSSQNLNVRQLPKMSLQFPVGQGGEGGGGGEEQGRGEARRGRGRKINLIWFLP